MSSIYDLHVHNKVKANTNDLPLIGVGLRHVHYGDALSSPGHIDFVEIHAENFFAEGGISKALLHDLKEIFHISLHATSLGLGSVVPAPKSHIEKLAALINDVDPILVSDHACFSWGQIEDITVHSGDLLPVSFNDENLDLMIANISQLKKWIKTPLLIENLSAYITPPHSTMAEAAFLTQLCEQTDSKILLDLNNLMVNAKNLRHKNPLKYALEWIAQIPVTMVGEIHLAGCSQVPSQELTIDDHSQPVSDDVWTLYAEALKRFGNTPTLIEWDLDLPTWPVLVDEAKKARSIAKKVFS